MKRSMNRDNSASRHRWTFIAIFLVLYVVAGCSAPQPPEKAIQSYLEAVVAKDSDRAASLSCAGWEAGAHSEVDAFKAVSPTLNNLACRAAGQSGSYSLVTCTGTIQVTYNGEARQVDLSGKTYRVAQEDGAWRMCGYQP